MSESFIAAPVSRETCVKQESVFLSGTGQKDYFV